MRQEIDDFDKFYMYKILIDNKSPRVIIWYIVFLFLSIILFLIVSSYKFPKYTSYQGFIEKEGENFVVETFIENNNVDFYNIDSIIYNNKEIKINEVIYSDEMIYKDSKEYLQIKLITDDNLKENSYIQFKIFKKYTTLLKELKNRIRKDLNL